jgi:UDP-glucose:(heptosyl)LPS alpha-1,3-glucosyltransferase
MKSIVLLKSSIGSKGGLEKVAKRFMDALVDEGYDVTLLTSRSSAKPLPELNPAIKTVTLTEDGPLSFLNLWRFDRAVKKWLEKNPSSLIFGLDRNSLQTHIRAGNGCHAAYLKLRKESTLKRLSFYVNPLHRLILSIEKRGFENPHLKLLMTNSELVKKQIRTHYNTPEDKIVVVHNAVEWHALQKPFDEWEEKRKELLAEWQIPEEHFVLLFAGHGYKRKGLPELLEALPNFDKVTLLVVGKDKTVYQSPQARFFGAQESLTPFLQVADALVIPSLYDPFANVTLEALAMGLFVCSTRTNGGSEILTPETGVIIDDSFPKALQETFKHKKTASSATHIRASVKDRDYHAYMKKLLEMLDAR